MKDIKDFLADEPQVNEYPLTVNESKSCPYCDIKDKDINSLDGKLLPNCSGDDDFSIIYKDYGDPNNQYNLLIST